MNLAQNLSLSQIYRYPGQDQWIRSVGSAMHLVWCLHFKHYRNLGWMSSSSSSYTLSSARSWSVSEWGRCGAESPSLQVRHTPHLSAHNLLVYVRGEKIQAGYWLAGIFVFHLGEESSKLLNLRTSCNGNVDCCHLPLSDAAQEGDRGPGQWEFAAPTC